MTRDGAGLLPDGVLTTAWTLWPESGEKAEPPEYHLTPYELRVLGMLVDGHNYKTAAAELGVTVHAVSFHMRRVYEKLRVHSKSEAVATALRQRLFA